MSDTMYTQEQVKQAIEQAKQQWEKEILQPVARERDELMQFKPKELTDEQKQIKQLQADLLQAKVVSALQQADLEDFVDFLNVENEKELQGKIDALSKILDQRKLNNSYIPQDHRQTDAFSHAQSKGDTFGMIKAIFSK